LQFGHGLHPQTTETTVGRLGHVEEEHGAPVRLHRFLITAALGHAARVACRPSRTRPLGHGGGCRLARLLTSRTITATTCISNRHGNCTRLSIFATCDTVHCGTKIKLSYLLSPWFESSSTGGVISLSGPSVDRRTESTAVDSFESGALSTAILGDQVSVGNILLMTRR
jgi:hypothetical protein